jgi:hypothetical protein
MAKNPIRVKAAEKAWDHADDWDISQVLADLPRAVEVGQHSSQKAIKVDIWRGQGKNKEKIGVLHIGKGGVWWKRGKSKPKKLNWRNFAAKMES